MLASAREARSPRVVARFPVHSSEEANVVVSGLTRPQLFMGFEKIGVR